LALAEDPEFLQKSHTLIQFYRKYPEIAAEDLLGIDLSPIQNVVLRAMWDKNYVMSIMCRGAGKCIGKNSYIFTDQGLTQIKNMMSRTGILQEADFSVSDGYSLAPAQKIYYDGVKPVNIITTAFGYSINVTDEHPLLIVSEDGCLRWKKAADIQEEDYVCLSRGDNVWGKSSSEKDLPYYLGLLVGNGCLTRENLISFSSEDDELLNQFISLTANLFEYKAKIKKPKNRCREVRVYSRDIRSQLFCLGLDYSPSFEKKYPSYMWNQERKSVVSFLQGLFDTDGYVSKTRLGASYCTSSKDLAEVVHLLLLNLGIVSKKRFKKNKKRGAYIIEIVGKNAISFCNTVGFRLHRKQNLLLEKIADCKINMNRDVIPFQKERFTRLFEDSHGIATRSIRQKIHKYSKYYDVSYETLDSILSSIDIITEDTNALQFINKSNHFFDRVVSKRFGAEEVYDLCMPEENQHAFVANGFINHNTFLLGVFACLKALLYPGHRVGLLAPTFRQSKMIFDEITKIWQRSPILQTASERKPTQQSDNCYLRFKATGGKNGSIIQAIPLGDGCLSDGLILLNDRLCLIQDLLSDDYSPLREEYLQNVSILSESRSFSPVEYVWSNGKTDNISIKTMRHYGVEGTPNHPVRVVRGTEIVWSRLDQLKEGDYIVIDRTPTWHGGGSEITQEEAYVAGLLAGDGNYTNQYYIGFATKDRELYQRLNDFFKQHHGKEFVAASDSTHFKLSGKKIRADFLERLGISGLYTGDKYFPSEILKAEKYKMSAYIQGLFDTDGGFEVGKNKGSGCVSFYNTSSRLVKDLQNILLLFGIVSTVSVRKSRNKNWADSYQLMITGNDVELFYKEIGFGLTRKQTDLEQFVFGRKRKTSTSDGIPQAKGLITDIIEEHKVKDLRSLYLNLNNQYKNGIPAYRIRAFIKHCVNSGIRDSRLDVLVDLVEKNYFYDRVSQISNSCSETYDVHVPNDHTFWSNGFISHNTKIRGSRFFTIVCDEFPHIPADIFNSVIRPMGATTSDPMERVRRVEQHKELLERGLITQEQIDEETASTNQIVITSSGYFTFNHMYNLYCAYKLEMLRNNEKYAVFRVPYWHLPEGFLDMDNVQAAKREMSSLEFRIEYEAAFIPDTDAFYKASLLEACSRTNFPTQVVGTPGKTYCLGVDPARSEDSFALCIMEMDRPAKVVCAYEFQKVAFPKMAAIVEDLCDAFNIEYIYMDAAGGGLAIKDILAENSRQHPLGPILDPDDAVHEFKTGRHILTMCNFTTDFISESNFACLRLLEHRDLLFPTINTSENPNVQADEAWETIHRMKQQMQIIELTETPTGKHHFDVPKGGGHGEQKKDLYTAFFLAGRCVYDVIWSEALPESILHHGGAIRPRDGGDSGAFGGLDQLSESNPELAEQIRDKIEMTEDPEGYRARLLRGGNKRTLVTSTAAVLRPASRKKKR